MKKIININGKEYSAKSSAYTQFKYKNDTGRRMITDLQNLAKLVERSEEEQVEGIEELLEIVLKMAYIMIEEADPSQVSSYEDFLKSIDGLFDNQQWMLDIFELASSPLSRGIKINSQDNE